MMRQFPLFLGLDGRRVVIVGGGEAATQKARLLARTTARLEVLAEAPSAELSAMAAEGRLAIDRAGVAPGVFAGARLVVSATGCAALDAVVADLARAAGALVNVVDRPALSDVTMPAIVDRDPVVIAIGTEGTAPVLARRLKTRLERMLEPGLGRFAALAGRLRAETAHRIAPAERRSFWEWVFAGPRQRFVAGEEAAAEAEIHAALAAGHPPAGRRGRISLIDPGPGEADLMTLRAVERLQRADLVLHDVDCPGAILDLARRDAERQPGGPGTGPAAWGLARMARLAAGTAAEDREVAWLTADPAAAEELARLGAEADVLPRVTAAEPHPAPATQPLRTGAAPR